MTRIGLWATVFPVAMFRLAFAPMFGIPIRGWNLVILVRPGA
jgi:hypothetical protein